MEIERISWCFD